MKKPPYIAYSRPKLDVGCKVGTKPYLRTCSDWIVTERFCHEVQPSKQICTSVSCVFSIGACTCALAVTFHAEQSLRC